jgi:hypothetical protein
MPDITGYIMSFGTSHFSSILLNRAVLEENRSIKTDSETFLCHFIGNVNYLAWPDPSLPYSVPKCYSAARPIASCHH